MTSTDVEHLIACILYLMMLPSIPLSVIFVIGKLLKPSND